MTAAAPPPTRPAGTPRSSPPAPAVAKPPADAPALVEVVPARQPATPSLLRVLMLVTVLAVLLFAGAAVGGLLTVRGSTTGAAAAADQINRLQQIRVALQRTDARAAQHLLAGQATDTAPDYRESLARARGIIIDAAEAEPGERGTLGAVNTSLDEYTTLLERARLSRDTPQGLTAFSAGTEILRTQVEAPLESLVAANEQRLEGESVRIPALVVTATGAVALVCILGTAAVVLVRFRRLVNPGLTAAVVLVAAAYGVSVGVMNTADSATRTAARIDLPILQATADAQRHGQEARSAEALMVVSRAADGPAARRWTEAADAATTAIDTLPRTRVDDLSAKWSTYRTSHDRVRIAAGAGRWDEARALVAGDRPGTTGESFAAFDAAAGQQLGEHAAELSGSLLGARQFVTAAAIIALLACGAAVAATVISLRTRLREYA